MKQIKITTSKGEFLLLETLSDNYRLFGFIKGVKLSEITEEQASEIVDNKPSIIYDDGSISLHYRNYLYHDI